MLLGFNVLFGVSFVLLIVAASLRVWKRIMIAQRLAGICGRSADNLEQRSERLWGGKRILSSLSASGLGPQAALGYTTGWILIIALVLIFIGWESALGVGAGAALGYVAVLRWIERRRVRQFVEKFPGFLERVRRLILIGNTLQQAFIQVAAKSHPVIRERMDPIVRRVQHGASLTEGVDVLAKRLDTIEMYMFAAYVHTNAKCGGRVSQNLESLIVHLKDKARLEREIKAATAETRASALILAGLTVFVIGMMTIMNPAYIAFFTGSDFGRTILAGIIGWPIIGAFVMKHIVTLNL